MENAAVEVEDESRFHSLISTSPMIAQSAASDSRDSCAGNIAGHASERTDEESPLLPRRVPSLDTAAADSSNNVDSFDHKARSSTLDFEGKPWWNRPSIWWLMPLFLLFTLATGGSIVPKLNLALSLVCRDYFSDRAAKDSHFTYLPVVFGEENKQCQIPEVQSLVARFQLYYNLASAILSALVSPRLGYLSDRYGRKKILALSAFGVLLGEVVTTIVAARPETSSLSLLLVGGFLDGLCGSITSVIALVNSYVSDCTAHDRRNVVFGYYQAILFGGIALGPFLTGVLIKLTGNTLSVFYAVLGFHLFFCLALVIFVPESMSKERLRAARELYLSKFLNEEDTGWLSLSTLNPKNILTPLAIFFPTDFPQGITSPRSRSVAAAVQKNLILLASIDAVTFGVAIGTGQLIIYYAEFMYGWGSYESSIFVSLANTMRVVTLLLFFPLITRLVRGRQHKQDANTGCDKFDIMIIRVSILFELAGYIGISLAWTSGIMMLSGVVTAAGGMGSPTLQSSLTKHVPRENIGQILGAIGLLHSLGRVVTPTVFNLIYSATVGKFTQAMFVCLSLVFALTFILSWFIEPHVYLNPPTSPDSAAITNPPLGGDRSLN